MLIYLADQSDKISVLNHASVFCYILENLSRPPKMIALSTGIKQNCKLLWEALEKRYNQHADLDLQMALLQWYRLTKSELETGMEFVT
jgi:hypothetical protein